MPSHRAHHIETVSIVMVMVRYHSFLFFFPPFLWVVQVQKGHQAIFFSNCFMKTVNMWINWICRSLKEEPVDTLLISVHVTNDTYFLVLSQMVNEGSDLSNSQRNYLLYSHWNWNFIENNFVSQFLYSEKCFLPFELEDSWAEYNGWRSPLIVSNGFRAGWSWI